MEINDLSVSWIKHAETAWAAEKLHDITSESHDEAWPIVFEIARKTNSDEVLRSLAIGPMEDMLCAHADVYYDIVVNEAESSLGFRKALLMGIRINNGEGSDKIIHFINELGKRSIKEGWNPNI